tara:strand:+ start:216 stop:620 length:405 start_codon:yes stop_codon:yes gene_type:complete
MLRALSVTAPVVGSVMIVVLLVEPPALRPAERLPTLRMLTVRAGEGLDQKRVQAADSESAAAQFNLGVKYATGQGVPQDYVQAHMWFNLAALRSTGEERESAVEARNVVADRMTPIQIAEAQRLAREWDAAHPR